MATASQFRQDMPPPGGYEKINYKRVPTKTFFRGITLFGIYAAVTTTGLYIFYLNCQKVKRREIEMKSASMATYPMLLAERDRAYLKQLRKNRDEETELMKNVEGWKTGTWYGEPIYSTLDKDHLIEPSFYEYYAHASRKDVKVRGHFSLNC